MTYPIFSVKFLVKKGLSYCKMVAKELGITNPEGDKRQVLTWAEAIVSHQNTIQPVEVKKQQVAIQFNDGFESCDLAGYSVVDLDGDVIRSEFRTYMAAERWAAAQFDIVDQQSVAQLVPLEQIENQIQERTETEQIVIREIDFAYSEVISIKSTGVEVLATISHDLETENWEVQLRKRFESFLTYAEAESFALNYIAGDERGSGRINIPAAIGTMGYSIECNDVVDPLGQRYTVRLKGYLAGNIWLNQSKGWTLNGFNFVDSPVDAAIELAQLTRKELV